MSSDARICSACGTIGRSKTVTRGSIAIEIILWLCFLVPGLIYSIWRLTTRTDACAACGSPALLPIDSPRGARIATDFHGESALAQTEDRYRGNPTRGIVYIVVLTSILIALAVKSCN